MPDHSPISNLSAALTHVMLGALVGGAYALSFLPWDFVAGSGVFWDSAVSDRATAMVGYRYFFADAWRWPLLAIGTLNVPDGSSVIFTDSIPIVAFLMKVLRTLGMTSVNYFGAWVLLCFAAVGAAMALVVWTAGVRSYAVTAMAALLASASPVLAHRWFHFSLCGQFVILLGIAAYLAADGVRRPQFLLTATAALVAVAIMVNPYLGAMVLGLYLATLVQSVRGALPAVGALIHLGATVGALAALVYAMGYIGHDGRSLAAQGFGHFSLNLLSPFVSNLSGVTPESWGRLAAARSIHWVGPFFLGAQPDATGGQSYEGFGYLGLGLLGLAALVAPYALANAPRELRRHWPLALVVAASTLFAASHWMHWGDQLIAKLAIPDSWLRIGGMFRSSGRFFWMFSYALLAAAVVFAVRRFGPARASIAIGFAAAVQCFDMAPMRAAIALDTGLLQDAGLRYEAWRPWLTSGLDRVYIVPSYACGEPDRGNPKLALQYFIAKAGPIPTNSVYASRTTHECGDEFARLAQLPVAGTVGWVFFSDGQRRPDVASFVAAHPNDCGAIGDVIACRTKP